MVWLEGLKCVGNESGLLECPLQDRYFPCSHRSDVSVICPGERQGEREIVCERERECVCICE